MFRNCAVNQSDRKCFLKVRFLSSPFAFLYVTASGALRGVLRCLETVLSATSSITPVAFQRILCNGPNFGTVRTWIVPGRIASFHCGAAGQFYSTSTLSPTVYDSQRDARMLDTCMRLRELPPWSSGRHNIVTMERPNKSKYAKRRSCKATRHITTPS